MGDEFAFRWAQVRVAVLGVVWRGVASAFNEALTDLINLRVRREHS
jgi:hypothetical protein